MNSTPLPVDEEADSNIIDEGTLSSSLMETSNFTLPQLIIIEQTPPTECETTGETEKHVHTVVKNTPFDIRLGFESLSESSLQEFNFNHIVFDAKLLYDTSELTEVDYVASKPFEMRRILQSNGNEIQMQFRLKVLSSHHENFCFIIKIHALHPVTGNELHPSMTVLSHPIRVISKPERKKSTKGKKAAPRRRKMEDRIKDSIKQIEKHQQNQIAIITSLAAWAAEKGYTGELPTPSLSNTASLPTSLTSGVPSSVPKFPSTVQNNLRQSMPSTGTISSWKPTSVAPAAVLPPSHSHLNTNPYSEEFSDSMEMFFMLYNTLEVDERHDRLRKLLRNCSKQELDIIVDFMAVLAKDAIPLCSRNVGCTCSFCPYEFQLQTVQLDEILPPDDSFSFYPE